MINFNNLLKKIVLNFVYIFCIISNLSIYATEFELEHVDLKNHARLYNNLPTARESNELLGKSVIQFESFFKEAEALVTHYEMESSIGLRLIHKHFILEDHQIMVENYEVIENTPSLITQKHTLIEAKEKGALPASWIFTDDQNNNGFLFEASSDPAVKMRNLKLQENPEFFNKIGNLLREYKLNNLISVAILQRSNLIAKGSQIYMENTYHSSYLPDRSIVNLWDTQGKSLDGFVRTSWGFQESKQQGCVCNTTTFCTPLGCYVNVSHVSNDDDDD